MKGIQSSLDFSVRPPPLPANSKAITELSEAARRLVGRLSLARPLAFLDLETTGVNADTDRIVEIAIVTLHPDGHITTFSQLVNPGVAIPEEATAVHGISMVDVLDAPSFASLSMQLAEVLRGCDIGGFNVAKFDLKMLEAEFARAGVPSPLSSAAVVDAMAIYHRNERRDLAAAVRFYRDREHKGHRAHEDVLATIEVFAAQLDRYEALPQSVDGLADYCAGRQPDWLTRCGRIAFRDGAARITFGKHSGKSLATMKKEESGYLNWMLERDFPSDLKALVFDALDGKFPSGPIATGEVAK